MTKGLAKFLVKATAPESFRLGLRQRTRAVRGFSRVFAGVNGVSTKIDESVLGGDLLELMSDYLRRLLQSSEQPKDAMSAAFFKPGFSEINSGDESSAEFETTPTMDGQLGNQIASSAARHTRRLPFESTTAAAAGQRENLLSRPVTTNARRVFTPAKKAGSDNRSINNSKNGRMDRSGSARLPASQLSAKLQEYWQLNNSPPSAKLQEDGVRAPTARSTADFSKTWPTNIFPERSQAGATGQQLVEKLEAFTSGLAMRKSSVSLQTGQNPDLPPNLEIQNIFHVEVKNDSNGVGSLGELSDKVADILREQALQHGVDIT